MELKPQARISCQARDLNRHTGGNMAAKPLFLMLVHYVLIGVDIGEKPHHIDYVMAFTSGRLQRQIKMIERVGYLARRVHRHRVEYLRNMRMIVINRRTRNPADEDEASTGRGTNGGHERTVNCLVIPLVVHDIRVTDTARWGNLSHQNRSPIFRI